MLCCSLTIFIKFLGLDRDVSEARYTIAPIPLFFNSFTSSQVSMDPPI